MARAGLGPGWRCLFANDIDAAKARAYARNWGADGLAVGDVGALAARELPTADLAWASFPCQDLSLAGAGAGLGGARSGCFMPFRALMRDLRALGRAPRAIVLENVAGLLTSGGGRDFADVCLMLWLIGYRCGALVIDALDFLPQSRPRLFIVAVDRDMIVPAGLCSPGPVPHWHPSGLRAAYARLRADLRHDWHWFAPRTPPLRTLRLIDLIEREPAVAWHSPAETERLLTMMTLLNRAKVNAVKVAGARAVGAVYRRTRPDADGTRRQRAEVRFDDVAGCLRTPGGGSSRQTVLIVEGGHVRSRLLSAREAARLMGLPDSYRLPERYNEAYHLMGDGVVVPVVRWLAQGVLEPLLAANRAAETIAA